MKKQSFQKIKNDYDRYVLNTYDRRPTAFVEAGGSWLTTCDGKKVLDFFPGWGVSNLGHCHPFVVKAIRNQCQKLIHLPNVFYIPDQGAVAKALIKKSFPGKVFFSNSGAEAVECAIKAARAWGQKEGKTQFISFDHSFHGRTMGAVTLTGQPKYNLPFTPLLPEVRYAVFNHLDSVKKLINPKTLAVILELVQGEGGVRIADPDFIKGLKTLADQNHFLLIFDEVQTGFGRTGKFFAFQNFGVKPHILCLAKAIAGGVPMGATILDQTIEKVLLPGMHASTFGGNYLACAAAKGLLSAFDKEKWLDKMKPVQRELVRFFKILAKKYSQILSFRHLGMMFGIEMAGGFAKKIADLCFERGLIINCTAGAVLRIMPALNLKMKDCKTGISIIEKAFKDVCG